jgi:predicted component of type VI protein secretion system
MQYLLERLAAAADASSGPPPRFDLRAAVRDQIQRLVSSRFWPGRPGLDLMGLRLPPVAGFGHACKPDVEAYAAGIRSLVLAHEPRLADVHVDVTPAGDPLTPFQVAVSGRLEGGEERDTFRFDLPQRG